MTINPKYRLGQLVYLVTDPDQDKVMITGYKICLDGALIYETAFKSEFTNHYEQEINDKRQVI